MFHNEARTHSAPSRGTVPQGKGREGKRKGMERNATAILCLVRHGDSQNQVQSVTREPLGIGGKR